MNFADVRNAYRNAPNPNQPISKDNYLAMLNIFGQLVPLAAIPDAYDTDFRRNLPGSGLSGFQVVSLLQRIEDEASITMIQYEQETFNIFWFFLSQTVINTL